MTYKKIVDWLYNQLPVYQRDGIFKYKLDLSAIKSVCGYLNNPQLNFISVNKEFPVFTDKVLSSTGAPSDITINIFLASYLTCNLLCAHNSASPSMFSSVSYTHLTLQTSDLL